MNHMQRKRGKLERSIQRSKAFNEKNEAQAKLTKNELLGWDGGEQMSCYQCWGMLLEGKQSGERNGEQREQWQAKAREKRDGERRRHDTRTNRDSETRHWMPYEYRELWGRNAPIDVCLPRLSCAEPAATAGDNQQ